MNFESLNDPMFRSLSEAKSRALRGGYTVTLTQCSDTTDNDSRCGDEGPRDKDKEIATISN